MHALVPLSLLESMREIDLPSQDDRDDFEKDIDGRRLGANPTVAEQIRRYRALVDKGEAVPDQEVLSFMRLCGRRPDADLVFSDAGRRAARLAEREVSIGARVSMRVLPRGLRRGLGWAIARRLARKVFDISLEHDNGEATGSPIRASFGAQATVDGSACGFFGSGVAALLRTFTDFDGAVTHDECVARDSKRCAWYTHLASRGETNDRP